jgi:hypothetical protein
MRSFLHREVASDHQRTTMNHDPEPAQQSSSSEKKIALFRSLFRGRDDVYPRRFESRKTGKSGYAPACANEWVRGICEKPRIKCAECPNRRFLPVTDEVIRWHLRGQDDSGQPFVAGVYPMLLDETCFFLAVDFDKSGWLDDSMAFMATCGRLGGNARLVQIGRIVARCCDDAMRVGWRQIVQASPRLRSRRWLG